jgi:hypothetical protein
MKKIKLISSAKLTALSMGLLLAVFCVLGMSFTPYEEGENVGDPNDTTYVSGPRRSHYTSGSGCSASTHSKKDLAKIVVTATTGGTATVTSPADIQNGATGVVGTITSTSIEWDCGNADNANAHKRVFHLVATNSDASRYLWKGWTRDGNLISTDMDYNYTMSIPDWNNSNGDKYENSRYTETLCASFVEKKEVTITMKASEGGSYTYNSGASSGTITTADGSLTTMEAVDLSADPASGNKFYGWYTLNGSTEVYFSYDEDLQGYAFDASETIYAKFIKSDAVLFQVQGVASPLYYDLTVAANAASTASNKVVLPTANGVLYGSHTIPSGVTLLIPFDAANTLYTTKPGINKAAPSGQSAFRKLTLAQDASITVNGAISVSAKQCKNQPYGGCVTGAYGQIDMKDNSSIILNGGAKLYCWGYITGTGMVEAKSGSAVYEDFQLTCWRGGSAASSMVNAQKVFALSQYYVQNIEAKIKFYAGAYETVYTGVTVTLADPECSVKIIGTSDDVMFKISSGSLTKWYDAATDRQMYQIDGNSSIGYVYIDMYATIDSRNYVLPLTNNMDITVNTGTLTCDKKIGMLPGAKITINEGANVSLGSNSEVYVYDKDNWGQYNFATSATKPVASDGKICSLPYCAATGTAIATKRSWTNTTDATMDINGTITTESGHFYTANGAADIHSSKGTGTIVFAKAAGTNANTLQATQSGTSITYVNIPTTAVQLHNEDDSYLATAGAAANTTITYANGHWGWKGIWEWNEGTTPKSHSAIAIATASLASQKPTGVTPTKDQTTEKVFSFNGNWTVKETIEENQEIIYEPQFDESPRPYTITWKDGKDRVITTTQVGYGLKPAYSDVEMIVIVKDEKPYRASFNGKWSTTNDNTPDEVIDVNGEATYYACYDLKLILNVGEVPDEEITQQQEEVEETQVDTQESLTVDENVTMAKTNVGNNGSLTITEGASLESGVTNVTEGGALEVTAGATVTTNATTVTTGGAVTISDNSAVTSTTTNVTGGAVAVENNATLETENLSVQNQGEVVVDNATVTTQNLDVQENSKVTIKNGATVNASTEGNDVVNPTTIAAGAEVEVEEGASFHTDEITLNVMQEPVIQVNDQNNEAPEINHNASQVSGNGEVTVKKAYFDFTHKDGFRARTWYAVAVPWEISIPAYENGGVYAKKNDAYVPMQLGRHFDLIHYNGAARARYGNNPETYWYCWRYVEDDIAAGQPAVMTPGKLYMIYLAEATDVIRFEKMEDAAFHYAGEVQTESNHSSDAADANWNGIANPNTYTSNLTYDDAEVGQTYVVTLDAEGNPFGTYVVVDLSKIYVGLPVFVQTTSQPVVKNQAPKRHMLKAQVETAPKIEVQIAPIGLTYSDRIFLQTENGKADTYVIGADVAKAGVSTRFAQMWVNRYDNKLCYNTVAPVNNSAYYPLGISIVRAGDYTISVPAENLNDKVYLTYDNRIIWDLSVAPYELSIEQGVNTHYGIRIIRNNALAVATDIKNVSEEELENGVQKVLMNNQVYVLREGILYTITGQKAQ